MIGAVTAGVLADEGERQVNQGDPGLFGKPGQGVGGCGSPSAGAYEALGNRGSISCAIRNASGHESIR